jgi:hypothetical protein
MPVPAVNQGSTAVSTAPSHSAEVSSAQENAVLHDGLKMSVFDSPKYCKDHLKNAEAERYKALGTLEQHLGAAAGRYTQVFNYMYTKTLTKFDTKVGMVKVIRPDTLEYIAEKKAEFITKRAAAKSKDASDREYVEFLNAPPKPPRVPTDTSLAAVLAHAPAEECRQHLEVVDSAAVVEVQDIENQNAIAIKLRQEGEIFLAANQRAIEIFMAAVPEISTQSPELFATSFNWLLNFVISKVDVAAIDSKAFFADLQDAAFKAISENLSESADQSKDAYWEYVIKFQADISANAKETFEECKHLSSPQAMETMKKLMPIFIADEESAIPATLEQRGAQLSAASRSVSLAESGYRSDESEETQIIQHQEWAAADKFNNEVELFLAAHQFAVHTTMAGKPENLDESARFFRETFSKYFDDGLEHWEDFNRKNSPDVTTIDTKSAIAYAQSHAFNQLFQSIPLADKSHNAYVQCILKFSDQIKQQTSDTLAAHSDVSVEEATETITHLLNSKPMQSPASQTSITTPPPAPEQLAESTQSNDSPAPTYTDENKTISYTAQTSRRASNISHASDSKGANKSAPALDNKFHFSPHSRPVREFFTGLFLRKPVMAPNSPVVPEKQPPAPTADNASLPTQAQQTTPSNDASTLAPRPVLRKRSDSETPVPPDSIFLKRRLSLPTASELEARAEGRMDIFGPRQRSNTSPAPTKVPAAQKTGALGWLKTLVNGQEKTRKIKISREAEKRAAAVTEHFSILEQMGRHAVFSKIKGYEKNSLDDEYTHHYVKEFKEVILTGLRNRIPSRKQAPLANELASAFALEQMKKNSDSSHIAYVQMVLDNAQDIAQMTSQLSAAMGTMNSDDLRRTLSGYVNQNQATAS